MKVKELIAELQKLDPTGELTVVTIRGDCDDLCDAGVNEIWIADPEMNSFSYSHDGPTKHCPHRAIEV